MLIRQPAFSKKQNKSLPCLIIDEPASATVTLSSLSQAKKVKPRPGPAHSLMLGTVIPSVAS